MTNDEKNNEKALSLGTKSTEIDLLRSTFGHLSDEQKREIAGYAVEKQLELQGKSAENDQKQYRAQVAIDDHLRTVDAHSRNRRGPTESYSVKNEIEHAAGRMTIESKGGARCFVATVVYGDAEHPSVLVLRNYRDEFLMPSVGGRVFCKLYYAVGPYLASTVSRSAWLRTYSRSLLDRCVERAGKRLSQL